ncbi:MAG: hypothetical protein AAF889_00400 [Cyanobacteria bacterium P01_D01_bin.73]
MVEGARAPVLDPEALVGAVLVLVVAGVGRSQLALEQDADSDGRQSEWDRD